MGNTQCLKGTACCSEHKKPAQYEERIIAYIDILGFKDMVNKSTQKGYRLSADDILNTGNVLNNIDNLLQYVYAWTTGQANTWDHQFIRYDPDVQVNTGAYKVNGLVCTNFSDNLAVSMPCPEGDPLINQHFSTFVSNLAHIGSKFIQAGIAIRGGIAVGELIHTPERIFGPALNEAVDIEKDIASYPRIILSNDLIQRLQFPVATVYPYRHFMTRFPDGCVGFHQMKIFEYEYNQYKKLSMDSQSNQVEHFKKLTDDITLVKEALIKNLDEQLCNPEVFAKYKWMADEFNKLTFAGSSPINMDLTSSGKTPHNIYYREVNEKVIP